MKQRLCERESEVVAAARNDSFSPELNRHVQSCSSCQKTQRVAQLFLQNAAFLQAQNHPMAASHVWRQAQRRKQELALKRATRPLLFMRVLSGIYIVALATWLLHNLWPSLRPELILNWSAAASIGTVMAILLIVAGSGYFLYHEKRSGNIFPSV